MSFPLAIQNNDYEDFGYNVAKFIYENVLDEKKRLRVISAGSYSNITHELYHYIGKYFKSEYQTAKREYKQALKAKLQEIADEKFQGNWFETEQWLFENYSPAILQSLFVPKKAMKRAQGQWKGVFELMRDGHVDGLMYRQGVGRFAKDLMRGNYVDPTVMARFDEPIDDIVEDFYRRMK